MGQVLDKPKLDKDTHIGRNEYLSFGVSGMQGYRLSMEDAHNHIEKVETSENVKKLIGSDTEVAFFGIYDGHSGSEASEYLSKNLLKALLDEGEKGNDIFSDEIITKSWLSCDKTLEEFCLKEGIYPGSTSITTIVKKNKDSIEIICPNVGDSRCVLCNNGKTEALSQDQKPTNEIEKRRIYNSDGFVEMGRVNGSLAVSRAFGDFTYKGNQTKPATEQSVVCVPEIKRVSLNFKEIKDSTEYTFLVLACDGIWDVMKNEEVVSYVKKKLDEQKQAWTETDKSFDLGKICQELLDYSVTELESKDNVSVCIVLFGY